jgi:DNA-binding MarR family transcriptional regulator
MISTPDLPTDYESLFDIDRSIHEPARLVVMALLYVIESADFTFVMNQTGMTWGNLSAHVNKLEEAGYIKVEKTFKGKRPNTSLSLSNAGRQAFQQYVQKMKQVFNDLPS